MNITMIVPTVDIKRNPIYRLGGRLYGASNPITGPLILGGILKRAGHNVEAYQELHGPVNYRKLLKTTDVVCIYTMTALARRAYQLGDMFHEKGHARVIIGGMHASALPEEALEHADQVIVGEGENVILDVVEGRITDPIVRTDPICDLDTVPFPDYSILKTPLKCANIMTSRGCPFRCTFCTTSRMFAPYRKRSVDNVIDEIKMCHELGFEYMNFEDDNFTADKERAKEICRRIIDENLQFKETFFFGRTDMADDPELLDLLAEAHLTRVLIGIESLNQEALDNIDKKADVVKIREACQGCWDHGIRVIASLVLGIDTDGPEDIRRAYRFAKSIGAYQIQPAILTPFPGTPVYEQFVSEDRMITDNWEQFDMTNVTFQPKKMSPWQLQEMFFEAGDEFYDFPSAKRIWDRFGTEYGLRRVYLAIVSSIGRPLGEWVADTFDISPYYYIKRTPWKYETPEQAAEREAEERRRAEV
ncbi:MAG: B12-binding domain-containing radical SAM protein, partial [Coriobacteriales bacterium]